VSRNGVVKIRDVAVQNRSVIPESINLTPEDCDNALSSLSVLYPTQEVLCILLSNNRKLGSRSRDL
jgi:hypothetical protein